MGRERSIDLDATPSPTLSDDHLLVHVYKDVSLDMWAARIRFGQHVLIARPHHGSLRDKRAATAYARRVINDIGLTGKIRWKIAEGPVTDDAQSDDC
jgi:hypothetical protein